MSLVEDPESGELVGPAGAVQALLDEEARHPVFRVWTEGETRPAEVLGGEEACVLVTDRPDGRRAVLKLAPDHVPLALAAWLDLGPRPVPAEPAIRLDPGAMAVLIGRGQAHGHGLDPEVATGLQRRLEAGLRHWTARFETGGWRRNLELLEGDGGIWRVRPVGDLVELAPTTTTAVVRELVALCDRARRGGRPAAP
jgi:hypothetical protein